MHLGVKDWENKQGEDEKSQTKCTYAMNKTTICTLVWLRLQELQPGLIPLMCQNCRFERKKHTKQGNFFVIQITKDAEMTKPETYEIKMFVFTRCTNIK